MQESNNKHSEKCPELTPYKEGEDKKRKIVNLILIFSWPVKQVVSFCSCCFDLPEKEAT